MSSISQGLNAITSTGGSAIPAVDYSIFKNKKIYIMTDNDEAGDKIAEKYIGVISGYTNTIKKNKTTAKRFCRLLC